MNYKISVLLLLLISVFGCQQATEQFAIADQNSSVSIVYDMEGSALDSIAAHLLAQDIETVTGQKPEIHTSLDNVKGNAIVLGDITSGLIRSFINTDRLLGEWETYGYLFKTEPAPGIDQAMFIVGSDPRGVAYGVFDLSKKMGVSPWYWWADVSVEKQETLTVSRQDTFSTSPSVKYRGIFLNDEDWGLQPWAAGTFEPSTGDIGPKTYAKIFELLLRLKGNTIWPAMHPSTRAFFHYPGNPETAKKWEIVVGSSHAEPMLRNNVDEWDHETMGDFNYNTNSSTVYEYWEQRVKESRNMNAIYTVGMRGIHDSGMVGASSMEDNIAILERVIDDQRGLLSQYVNEDVSEIPQSFTAYKEVLDIYDSGLALPEDITITWPDDNYGYIRRFNNMEESRRPGGSGVYYHASYWGRPHDYLWLDSTHPALIREEMAKAYETGARDLWILNVGDIKPLEYNISLFMDMAFNMAPYLHPGAEREHQQKWMAGIFGTETGSIDEMMWTYYDLAFERRPEFMGWSQTEPITPTQITGYNHFAFGDEAQSRIDNYDELEQKAEQLRDSMPEHLREAYYQLVYYPVVGASQMNKKFLYRDKAWIYAGQGRLSAQDYARKSRQAYQRIVEETEFYNNELAGGKWRYMMSMEPRDLPVYQSPEIEDHVPQNENNSSIGLAVEGDSTDLISSNSSATLTYTPAGRNSRFVDIFLKDSTSVPWSAASSVDWIQLSDSAGTLVPESNQADARIEIQVDWPAMEASNSDEGSVTFTIGEIQKTVEVKALRHNTESVTGFAEADGYISIFGEHYDRTADEHIFQWERVEGLGHTGQSMLVTPLLINPDSLNGASAVLEYNFHSFTSASPEVRVFCLPTHPINNQFELRLGVQIDDSPVDTLNFRTHGRSEEWKQNVLSNTAIKSGTFPELNPGKHTLRLYAVDPGLILDRIEIDMGGLPQHYGVIDETKQK